MAMKPIKLRITQIFQALNSANWLRKAKYLKTLNTLQVLINLIHV